MNDGDLTSLLADQRERWRRGDMALVEFYVSTYPQLGSSRQQLLDAIYHEMLLREENGQRVLLEDYLGRFPDLAEDLRPLFEVHAALSDEEETGPPLNEVDGDRPDIPGYEILEELGRGAMGVVYKARQTALNRLVALKLVLSGHAAGADELFLFRREAEALGRLKHPHIVQVYDFGEYDGQPFLVMELVEGTTLEEKLRDGPLAPDAAATLVALLAQGVHAAHTRGLIHRDLKPSNVLLTPDGTPKISDFGLARHVQGDPAISDPSGTASAKAGFSERKVLGTPAYMAPEQASGESARIGPATDVYALGGILYATQTCRPPQPSTLRELLHFLQAQQPPSFAPHRPRPPQDLEAVCLKSLAWYPDQRYPSALELAEDLNRYQKRLPVAARPVGRLERGRYWCRRNPLVTTLAALMVVVVSLAFAGVTTAMVDAVRERNAKEVALGEARDNAAALEVANGQKQIALVQVQSQADKLTAKNDELEHALYRSNIHVAARAVEDGDLPGAERALAGCPPRLRAFEWRYLDLLCRTPRRTWHVPGKEETRWIGRSLDGYTVAAAVGNVIYLLDATTGTVKQTLRGHFGAAHQASFSWKGSAKRLVTADQLSVIVWDCDTGKVQKTISADDIGGQVLAAGFLYRSGFQATGDEILVVSHAWRLNQNDSQRVISLRIWDLREGKWTGKMEGGKAFAPQVVLSHDARFVAIWALFNPKPLFADDIQILDTLTGQEVCTLRGHTEQVRSVAFSLSFDRDRFLGIVTGGVDRTVRVWDSTGRERLTLVGHRAEVTAVAFASPGGQIVSAGNDRTVRTWDQTFGRALEVYLGHPGPVSVLNFGLKGDMLAAGGPDGSMTVWSTPGPVRSIHLADMITSMALNRTGDRLACTQWLPTSPVVLFDTATGEQVRTWTGGWSSVAVNADGTRMATAMSIGKVQGKDLSKGILWNTDTGKEVRDLGPVTRVAFSPDGDILAALSGSGPLLLCDGRTGEVRRQITGIQGIVITLAFRADGRQVAAGFTNGRVQIWTVADGQPVVTITTHQLGSVRSVSLSPDGATVATCGDDADVGIWDTATGKARARWPGPAANIVAVAYSPDGRTLAVAAGDRKVRLWDAATGEALLTLAGGWKQITYVAFSGDGNRLAVGGLTDKGSEIRIWDAGVAARVRQPEGN